jgi:D-arabinose 1-dehydrogenase-like Zn-dependent alcohol dehydrogenase
MLADNDADGRGRMKSFDVFESGAPLQAIERPTPQPAGTEVLLRMVAAGVCHSDLHLHDGGYDLGGGRQLRLADRGVTLPLTLGHENVGEVVSFGADAAGVAAGDVRLVYPWIGCGTCSVCRAGEENLCLAQRSLGVFRPGGYSDHLLVPHPRYLLDIGDLQPAQAAPLACSGLTTFSALRKLGALIEREVLLIIGAGGLGLMCLSLLRSLGGRGAVVADIDPAKRMAAQRAGALATVDPAAQDARTAIADAAGGALWAALDFVGSPTTVSFAVDALTKGGRLIVVGLFGGEVALSLPLLPIRALTIQGSYVGNLRELGELVALVRRTGAPALPVRTRPLHEANAALDDLRAGRVVGRVVLTP